MLCSALGSRACCAGLCRALGCESKLQFQLPLHRHDDEVVDPEWQLIAQPRLNGLLILPEPE